MDNHNRQNMDLPRKNLQHNQLKILQRKKLQAILQDNKLQVIQKSPDKSQNFQPKAVLRNLLRMLFPLMMVMKNSKIIKEIRNKMVTMKMIKRRSKMKMEIKIQRVKMRVKMMMDKRISNQMMIEKVQARTSEDNRLE